MQSDAYNEVKQNMYTFFNLCYTTTLSLLQGMLWRCVKYKCKLSSQHIKVALNQLAEAVQLHCSCLQTHVFVYME